MIHLKKLAVIAVSGLLLAACSKLNKANYDMLEMGMSQDEVKAVIGEPANCSETLGTTSCLWGDEEGTYVKVTFIADNAVTFSNNGLK